MSEIKVTFVQPDGSKRIIDVEEGNTLMEAAKYVAQPYVEGIEAICGGQCICATCHVWVDKKWIDEVGLPEDNMGIRTVIGSMPAIWVVNFRDKIFK